LSPVVFFRNVVECSYSEWSEWSTECGVGKRSRRTISLTKTVEKLICDEKVTQCEEDVQEETRKELCKS